MVKAREETKKTTYEKEASGQYKKEKKKTSSLMGGKYQLVAPVQHTTGGAIK